MLSRAAFEANVATFLIIIGVTLFLAGVRKSGFLFFGAAVALALSAMTFNTARVVTPVLLLILAVAFRRRLWEKKLFIFGSAILGVLILLPTIKFLLAPQSRLRFQEVNIFTDSSVVDLANQEIVNDGQAWWSGVIHNRRWGYVLEFTRHYFDNLDPRFLFIKGDGNPKFSTQDVGELYLWEAPFLVLGLITLFRKKVGCWWLIPFWLVIGILPAATARETPHALRIESTLPTWQILVSLGLVSFFTWIRSKDLNLRISNLIIIGLIGIEAVNFVYFQHGYWAHYPQEYAAEWQYGYKPAIDYLSLISNQYDQVWFTDALGRPYIYFLFYQKVDPKVFQAKAQIQREVYGFVNVSSLGNYNFFRIDQKPTLNGHDLFVYKTIDVPPHVQIVKNFYLPDGSPVLTAFTL